MGSFRNFARGGREGLLRRPMAARGQRAARVRLEAGNGLTG